MGRTRLDAHRPLVTDSRTLIPIDMSEPVSRREALKQMGAAGTGLALGRTMLAAAHEDILIAGQPSEIGISPVIADPRRACSVASSELGSPQILKPPAASVLSRIR